MSAISAVVHSKQESVASKLLFTLKVMFLKFEEIFIILTMNGA